MLAGEYCVCRSILVLKRSAEKEHDAALHPAKTQSNIDLASLGLTDENTLTEYVRNQRATLKWRIWDQIPAAKQITGIENTRTFKMKKHDEYETATVDHPYSTKLKDWLHPLLLTLAKSKIKYNIEVLNDLSVISRKPIIFAGNHSTSSDFPIVTKVTGRRSYVLVGKQRLPLVDRVFFHLNGVIWVDRKNKGEMTGAKKILLEYLSRGQSITWFPEGTWNLTPNLLMLPMRWGIIEVARQADAQIIPLALDYDRSKNLCRVKFGAPLAGANLVDNRNGIRTLRDVMATLRWEMMEDRPILSRAETDLEELRKEVEVAVTEYPVLDWEYECSCIYQPPNYISSDEAFEYLQHLIL